MQDLKTKKLIEDLHNCAVSCIFTNGKAASLMQDAADALEGLLDVIEHYKKAYHKEFDARMELIGSYKEKEKANAIDSRTE